ncbi:MAG: DUF5017 domain-containing protein [Bacteroides sp.]|nr:DUF5017 domain-containing protein [Bacteroides sp.]
MNKNILTGLSVALLLLSGCDYNDKYFDGLDDMVQVTDVKKLEYTLTDADYATIASNNTNKDIAAAAGLATELAALSSNKYFTSLITAEVYAPAFLANKWSTADNKSTVQLTYNMSEDLPEYLSELSGAESYTLKDSDYKTVWGDDTDYFTPTRSPKNNLPRLLNSVVTDAEEGDYLLVTYRYSDREPGTSSEIILTEMDEDFSGAGVYGEKTTLEGWTNYGGEGEQYWMARDYGGNFYSQVGVTSASGAAKDLDSWLVTPRFDLSGAVNPMFSFEVCTGSNNGARLQIMISEDYNGSDPTVATWTDVSTNFYIPTLPTSGYGTLTPAGVMNMSAYQSAEFYIAFRFTAATGVQGAYQIDNVQVGDVNTVVKNQIAFEDFETIVTNPSNTPVELLGWNNIGNEWVGYNYSGNSFPQVTAYDNGDVESYLISPAVAVEADSYFSFDVNPRYYAGDVLSVLISEDFNGDAEAANWIDITSEFAIPAAQTEDFVSAGVASLNDYVGKTLYFAFKYVGSQSTGTTTTMRIDNFSIYTLSRTTARMNAAAASSYVGTVVDRNAVYEYNGSTWVEASNIVMLDPEDYTEMGGSNPNFSSSFAPDTYLPVYLKMNYPYAQEDNVVAVVYAYYADGETTTHAVEYVYTQGEWVKNVGIVEVTEQYAKIGGEWVKDPSVTVELTPVRGLEDVSAFMQAVVDYVAETFGEGYLQTGYTNAEFYYGFTSYYNNVSFRLDYWRGTCLNGPEAYGSMSDDELRALQFSRLPEAFIPGLKAIYPNADVIEGGNDVIYTINFGLYTNYTLSAVNYTIQYVVTGKGEFEYIEGSLQELK